MSESGCHKIVRQDSGLPFEDLHAQAKDSLPVFERLGAETLAELCERFPGIFDAVRFESGELKSLARARDKIDTDYNGDHTRITDLVRGRLVVVDPGQIQVIRAYLSEKREAGLCHRARIENICDRFAEPSETHWRDLKISVRLANGHVAEFRVEHEGLIDIAPLSHEIYETVQEIERRATREQRPLTAEERRHRQELVDRARDLHDSVFISDSHDELLNDKGRAMLLDHYAERLTRDPHFLPPLQVAERKTKPAAFVDHRHFQGGDMRPS